MKKQPKAPRITKRTPITVVPAVEVKAGDTLSTRDGDALPILRCYERNGEIVMHFDRSNVRIPKGASLSIFVTEN